MGVQGLWQLIQSTGRPVTLESLEGKVLAIDVSIWLHKTIKGMKSTDGNQLPNAHLLGLFKRVCKLLFYKIKPIFVFDGTAPTLKKQTLNNRRNKARKAALDSHNSSTKILTNYLKSQLIRKTLGDGAASRTYPVTTKVDDMYAIPDQAYVTTERIDEEEEDDWGDEWDIQNEIKNVYQSRLENLSNVDPDDESFRSMPSEVQHEILVDMKERRKHSSWYSDVSMPQDSEEFSRYQLAKMLKQSNLTIRIDRLRKEMSLKHLSHVTENFEGELEANRVMSDDTGHYVLMKGPSTDAQKEMIDHLKNKIDKKSEPGTSCLKNDSASTTTKQNPPKVLLIQQNDVCGEHVDITTSVGTSKTVVERRKVCENEVVDMCSSDSPQTKPSSRPEGAKLVEEKADKGVSPSKNAVGGIGKIDPSQKFSNRAQELRRLTTRFFNESRIKDNTSLSSDSDSENDDSQRSPHKRLSSLQGTVSEPPPFTVVSEAIAAASTGQTVSGNQFQSKSDDLKDVQSLTNKLFDSGSVAVEKIANDILVTNPNITTSRHDPVLSLNFTSPCSSNKSYVNHNPSPSRAEILKELQSKIHKLKAELSTDDSSQEVEEIHVSAEHNTISGLKREAESPLENIIGKRARIDVEGSDSASSDGDDFVAIEEHVMDENIVDQESDDAAVVPASPDSRCIPESSSTSSSKLNTAETNVVNEFQGMTKEELELMANNLELEGQQLEQNRAKQERVATTLSEQIHLEAQELLRLFGVPFITSPTEAEAQCAYLDMTGQCDGSITDDSDIWLFGGERVYKNFFNQSRHVEFFKSDDLERLLSLDRDKFINLALLCGSDYTDGVPGVGVVSAMEIMAEFPGEGQEGLRKFKSWWDAAVQCTDFRPGNKIRAKLRKLEIKASFPNAAVINAYKTPAVDESEERFTWSKPDLDLLRNYTGRKFGWSVQKADDILLPMLRRFNEFTSQRSITSYFGYIPEGATQVNSARLKEALSKMQCPKVPTTLAPDDLSDTGDNTGTVRKSCGRAKTTVTKTTQKVKRNLSTIVESPSLDDGDQVHDGQNDLIATTKSANDTKAKKNITTKAETIDRALSKARRTSKLRVPIPRGMVRGRRVPASGPCRIIKDDVSLSESSSDD